ncbi:hypothetical protein CIB48_g750 [Xylaria polymorpha]|nr:hypothetical protein CIB48_g750 [Xylaria polymorpha]
MEGLRSALQPLQPLTHNLPVPIRDLGVSIIGETCYKTLVLDLDPTDSDCLKLAISKGLGIGIVGASAIVKVPQIIKLLQSRSASGISFLSYLLETSSYLITLAYNLRNGFPFSTFGETALILGQNVVITVLVLNYSGRASIAALFVAALAIAAIFQEGGTGQLSAFTVFNYLAGSLSRIFTTLQEVDDKLILYGFIAGFTLNLVLAAQMVYYWNAPSAKAKGKMKEVPTPSSAVSSSASPTSKSNKGPSTRRRG